MGLGNEPLIVKLVGYPGRNPDYSPALMDNFAWVSEGANNQIWLVPTLAGHAPRMIGPPTVRKREPADAQEAELHIPWSFHEAEPSFATLEFRSRPSADQPFDLKSALPLKWGHAELIQVEPQFAPLDSTPRNQWPAQFEVRVVFENCVPLDLRVFLDDLPVPFTVRPELLLPSPTPTFILAIPKSAFESAVPFPMRLKVFATGTPTRTIEVLLGSALTPRRPLRPNRISLDRLRATYPFELGYTGGRGVKRVWTALVKGAVAGPGTEDVRWSVRAPRTSSPRAEGISTLTAHVPLRSATRSLSFVPSATWLGVEDKNGHVAFFRISVAQASPATSESARGFEEGINRFGGDYTSLGTASSNDCSAACRNAVSGQCKAWTFVWTAPTGGPNCFLKDRVPPASAGDCCVSGVMPSGPSNSGSRRVRTYP